MAKKKQKKSGKERGKPKSGKPAEEVKKKSNEDDASTSMIGTVKMTLSSIPLRQHREKRTGRPPGGKRLAMKELPGKLRSAYRRSLDPCDNSNDSGLGFDHHSELRHAMGIADRLGWPNSESKRPRIDIKVENDDDNDGYSFPETIRASKENANLIRSVSSGTAPNLGSANNQHGSSTREMQRCAPIALRPPVSSTITLTTQLTSSSRISDAVLTIVKQPEQQHRARYQTEGSRGAVKDREGNGFPIVQLNGYHSPATLQVFIGTDVGKVSPHMFYQACKVSGKNSTPCIEKKIDGTCVIEVQLDPSKDMSATCDCVGILKERNVDVEHRFPDQLGNRSKKKSTRCRMIFRCTIIHDDGRHETLQVCSQPIVCTQPPGVPEICKKSLTACPANGGLELFVLGKNFSKDTKVYFQQVDEERLVNWEQTCVPDKEYLQQTHFVCVVPPYRNPSITEPASVRLFVVASGKTSESHQFVYTPVNGAVPSASTEATSQQSPFFNKMIWPSSLSKRDQDLSIMPPPETSMVPLSTRRPSLSFSQSTEIHSPPLHSLKQEYIDENSQNSIVDATEVHHERYRHISESSMDVHHSDSNTSLINENSMDVIRHNSLVSGEMLHHDNSNLSVNENSLEMIVRRNSLSRSMNAIHESSMDVNIGNSNMAVLNEDSSCSSGVMIPTSNNCLLMNSAVVHQPNVMSPSQRPKEREELKVMDLRMKMPMATVADLASTSAPSMATLHNFGVTEASIGPLPAQSAQSVETFLTNIESKTSSANALMNNLNFKDRMPNSLMENQTLQIQSQPSNNMITPANDQFKRYTESVFMSSQQSFLLGNNASNTSINILKTEVVDQHESREMLPSSVTTPFNTERLDAFLNCAANQMINNTSRSEPVKDNVCKLPIIPNENQTSMLLSPQSSLLVPMTPNPQISPSSDCGSGSSPNTMLGTQVSPGLICQTSPSVMAQDVILPSASICSGRIENSLIPASVSPQGILLSSPPSQDPPSGMNTLPSSISPQMTMVEPEKAVLLEAAADLLQTQKKLSELVSPETKEPMMNKLYMNNLISMGTSTTNNSNVRSPTAVPTQISPTTENFPTAAPGRDEKSDFMIPISVKEMQMSASSAAVADKKIEDRMIPQGFTTLTENELINLINPSCFDQV